MKHPNLPPELPDGELDACLREAEETGDDVTGVRLPDLLLTEERLDELGFYKVAFDHCKFSGCSLRKASFTDVVFRACDLSNCDLSESYWNRCELIDCKGVGANFLESRFFSTRFLRGVYRYAGFDSVVCNDVAFEESDLTQCNFAACKWKKVILRGARCVGVSFFGTPLASVDFTTCTLEGITVSDTAAELRGAVVTALQAVDLARLLGLVIRD